MNFFLLLNSVKEELQHNAYRTTLHGSYKEVSKAAEGKRD